MADNGPGVPPTVADRLFRLRVTTRVDAPLAGYGLLVASELLRLSGRNTPLRADTRTPARDS